MVAVPASSETSNRPTISRPPHSASFAANDIWKLGWTIASGASSSTPNAATVSVRKVSVGRSTNTPMRTMPIMMKGALGRNLRARQQKIECRRDQGGKRRPFLDGMAAAEGRHQRKQRAERKEHDAGHHRHVITR